MASPNINITAKEAASQAKFTIKIKRLNEFKIRTWIVTKLINLARWISWFEIEESIPKFEGYHRGDPCIYCDTPHDDVQIGNCPGYVNSDELEIINADVANLDTLNVSTINVKVKNASD